MAPIGLSFLQIFENPSLDSKNLDQNNDVYVHPMAKRSASALSSKSLEMCTESLGSETGSEGSESGDEFCAISLAERERLRGIQRSKCRSFGRKTRRNDFPPPLTSISGQHGAVNVRQHRENGRLVIKAVTVFNCGSNFKAERTNGRLKLSLLRDRFVNYENGRGEIENYESERGEIENYESGRGGYENYEEGGELESDDGEEGGEKVAVTVAEEGGWRWDMNENRWLMAGKGELKMVTRCKEGGNENKVFSNNWRSWVAIS